MKGRISNRKSRFQPLAAEAGIVTEFKGFLKKDGENYVNEVLGKEKL